MLCCVVRPLLDVLDGAVGTVGLLIAGLATAIALFWLGDPRALLADIGPGTRGAAGRLFLAVGRYLIPAALAGTLMALAFNAG